MIRPHGSESRTATARSDGAVSRSSYRVADGNRTALSHTVRAPADPSSTGPNPGPGRGDPRSWGTRGDRTARPTGGRATRGDSSAVFTPGVPRHEFGWRIVIHLIPLYETRSDSAASTPRPTPRRRATSHGTEPKTHVGDLRRSSARGNRAVTDRPPSSSGPPVRNRRQYWAEGVRHRSRSEAVIPNADRPRAAGSVLALVADTRPRNDTPGVLDILVYDTSAVRDPLREVENRSSFLVRRTGGVGSGPDRRPPTRISGRPSTEPRSVPESYTGRTVRVDVSGRSGAPKPNRDRIRNTDPRGDERCATGPRRGERSLAHIDDGRHWPHAGADPDTNRSLHAR